MGQIWASGEIELHIADKMSRKPETFPRLNPRTNLFVTLFVSFAASALHSKAVKLCQHSKHGTDFIFCCNIFNSDTEFFRWDNEARLNVGTCFLPAASN